ncbi:uncharacterized protein LOC126745607 isoform X2 [Anthonomus grandis grandis]|nr:uncharacterized protein LOC126745607 isoform X2 [Anthonomus grandis grandis]XP_050309509.1 uncharacterized protein LOC126745607 isoform X2 [Anthonomus grandis grandis]XP_050309516.1 uncharacterized protein LOC126745607 isoform X2 [Anthonomus grandis grandis]
MVESVKINRLRVPEIVKHGNQAILDCDFTMDASENDLVLKWYFNKSLVYQWIPGTKKRPQSLGVLKDRVNLEYQASVDANSIHRALHILSIGPDLSGNFTCSVSTLESEDEKTKSMLVLVSEKYFELKRLKADEGYIRVQCRADGIFPKPVMSLHSQQRPIPEADVMARQLGYLYEVSAQVTLPELERAEEFSCKLHIPQANYTTRRETVFYPGASNAITSSKWLILTISSYVVLQYIGLG